MNDVLYFLREGKTRDEVFRLTGVDSNQIDTWYRKGKNNPTVNYKYFRQELDNINNDPVKIRNMMDIILINIKNGKSREESVIAVDASTDDISNWILKGKKNYDENTIYFSQEYSKIINMLNNEKSSRFYDNDNKKRDIDDSIINSINKNSSNSIKNNISHNVSDEEKNKYKLECFNYNKYSDNNEKLKMNCVLSYLREGKSICEAANLANVNYNIICNWIENGRYQSTKNTLYFFGEYNKIISKLNKE